MKSFFVRMLPCVKVNNIPHVGTQSDFRALIKAQNIPHPSYDIDGDGVVSQEDYALAKVRPEFSRQYDIVWHTAAVSPCLVAVES